MPPNAGIDNGSAPAPKETRTFLNEFELPEDCVAIDGIVYSLKGWNHPGGDQIFLFGGNDVTVHYRMIHPFHGPNMLSKMPIVGKMQAPKHKDYTFGSAFEKDLIAAVQKVVKPKDRFATPGFWMRAIFYIALYFTLLGMYVFGGSGIYICIGLGVAQALIGLNVQHDANHGAVSANPFWNDLLGYGADLIGGNKYLWMQQHWTHHAFTNDVTRDPDTTSTDPFFLFHNYPKESPLRTALHAFQHFYMLPVLSFYWASVIFNPTCVSVHHEGAQVADMRFNNWYLKENRKYTWGIRIFYLFCTCVTPFLYHDWMTACFHIWFMSIVESLTLAIPFGVSHNFEDSDRAPVEKGPVDWYKSQCETSCTYGGYIAGWLTGGLNFQIEHHLFPRMSSAWYPYIQPEVMRVCKEHGVKYAFYPTFYDNIKSTLKYISDVGSGKIAPETKVKAS